MKIEDVRTEWLRVANSPPIADSSHVLRFMDLIVVKVRAGDHSGWSYMLSFDYAPGLLKGIIDQELKRYVVGSSADEIRDAYDQNLQATEYVGREGLAMWGTAAIDVALWDLLARRLEAPASLLFGRRFSAVPVYGSGGWISYSDQELADEVCRYIARGFGGVKIKIGSPQEDRSKSPRSACQSLRAANRPATRNERNTLQVVGDQAVQLAPQPPAARGDEDNLQLRGDL